jgi:hypothetical protein
MINKTKDLENLKKKKVLNFLKSNGPKYVINNENEE